MSGVLDGQVALVTGGGRGFGAAIAQRLAAAGARVAVTARTGDQLDATVAAITEAGGRALAVPGDVTSRSDVAHVVREAGRELGPITLFVNNAGVADPFGPIGELDPDRWWATQAVHVRAPVLFLSELLPGMRARGGGRVIIVSAKAAHVDAPYLSAYCVAKTAQNRIAKLVAIEQRDAGIRTFAIDPGFVYTELAAGTMNSPDAQRWLPGMVARLRERQQATDNAALLTACGERCVALACGRYDALSGHYLEMHEDLDALLAGAQAG